MRSSLRPILAAAATACLSFSAQGSTIVQVYDFEDPALHATQWNIVTAPGNNEWTSLGVDDTAVVPSGYNLGSIQGDRVIRTWNRGVTTPPTAAPVIGDSHTGAIRTDPFALPDFAVVDFLIGGGAHPWGGMDPDALGFGPASFNLEREVGPGDWETIATATGPNANQLSAAQWSEAQLLPFNGDTVRFAIYDLNTGGWGHIDVDNIVLSVPEPIEPLLIIPALSGILLVRRRARRKDG